jgi:hypothetical protein
MDMTVLNLPKAEEVLNVKKEYEDNQLKRWEEFKVNCKTRVKGYIEEHLQEWFMICIEKMKKYKKTYTTYNVPIPCDVIWENIKPDIYSCVHTDKADFYAYQGRQITFEVLNDILVEFNKQKENTHYVSSIYGGIKDDYREAVYCIRDNYSHIFGGAKTLYFGRDNSYYIEDIFDGNFCVRISFSICKED